MSQAPTSEESSAASSAHGLQMWIPLVALWLVWGSTYLGIAITGTSMPPFLSNGLRFLGAALVVALVTMVRLGPSAMRITASQARSTAMMGVMLLGVGIGTLGLAERYVPSGIAALLVSIMPAWIILFRFRAGERPARLTLIGVAIGLTGLVLMLLPGGTKPVEGSQSDVVWWSLAIMGSSFCWAFFSWRARRYDVPANSLVTAVYELAFAAVFLCAIGLIVGERVSFAAITTDAWLAWVWLIVASVIGYTSYSWLLAHVRMSLVSTYAFVNPVVAVLLGLVILGEPITLDVAIGLFVVVGSVALIVLGERQPS